MTHIIENFGKATTAIAAVLALSTTPSLAQDVTPPPDPVVDTTVQSPEAVDPLAPEATTDVTPAASETAVPPAPKPKVETGAATPQRTKPTSSAAARSPVRRASAPPTAIAAPSVAEAATTAPLAAELPPPPAMEPAPPPVAQPAASDTPNDLMSDFMAEPMLPMAGALALGLVAMGAAGFAMNRRKRRREDEEFEARQQALAMINAEPTLELDPADQVRPAEVRPGPAFVRATPVHDPVPAKGNWESRPDADFLFRRADQPAKDPLENN